jgi:threonine/homoserine/homoserine lactone efflux protein
VDPKAGNTTTQILVLGVAFVVAGLVSDGMYAILAGTIGDHMVHRPRWRRNSRYAAGAIYIALGAAAAFSGSARRT